MQGTYGLDLVQTFTCGQCFRWHPDGRGGFTGAAGGRTLSITPAEIPLLEKDPFWRTYFDLDTDYDALREQVCAAAPALREAARAAQGMRILRQDPWEALCTFILSQNNNIPRITGIITRLCACLGGPSEPAPPPGPLRQAADPHPFPTAGRLAACSPEDLAPLRCGFRARYVLDAAQKVASGQINLQALRHAPLDEARAALQTICGVGPKVADCALLYGLHRMDAFPVDVWIRRAMPMYLPGVDPHVFGDAAGLAQQYLFAYARTRACG